MAFAAYLVDTSAFARLSQPRVSAAFAPMAAAGRVKICAPVAFELGFTARNAAEHAGIMHRLEAFETAPVTESDHRRALDIQQLLARRGRHRALSLVDALVAAIAENCSLTVLHYDAAFEMVSAVTGQPNQWIVPRGTAD